MAILETVLAQALQLNTLDKVRLIERVTPTIEEELRRAQIRPAYPSLWGICQGKSPSVDDIDQARREMWADFPREDIP